MCLKIIKLCLSCVSNICRIYLIILFNTGQKSLFSFLRIFHKQLSSFPWWVVYISHALRAQPGHVPQLKKRVKTKVFTRPLNSGIILFILNNKINRMWLHIKNYLFMIAAILTIKCPRYILRRLKFNMVSFK